jgi:hypothetical protein
LLTVVTVALAGERAGCVETGMVEAGVLLLVLVLGVVLLPHAVNNDNARILTSMMKKVLRCKRDTIMNEHPL